MKILDWDTDFWGVPTGLANSPGDRAEDIQLMWLLVPSDDVLKAQEAERLDWRFVDIRVKLEQATDRSRPRSSDIREWNDEDLPDLVALARRAHHNSRFYADPNLDDRRCDDLYEQWIRNSCLGWAQRVFVCEGAYVTVHVNSKTASIGLIAVPEEDRGRGVGMALLEQALGWAYQQGLQRMTVVTQGRNVESLRLYQRAGFEISTTSLWFHKGGLHAP